MRRCLIALLLSLLSIGSAFSTANAQTYQPLDEGLRWIYSPPTGTDRDTIVVAGPAVFDGVNAIEFRYHGYNDGLSNFWTVDPDGSVLFHGFDLPDVSLGVRYVPPIRMVVPPIVAGHAWRDTIFTHCFRSPSPCNSDTVGTIYVSTIDGISPHTVPAGTFTAVAVDLSLGFVALERFASVPGYSIFGTIVAENGAAVGLGGMVRWWAEDVGMIENYNGWSLLSFDRVTPAHAASWGQLKKLYRSGR